MNNISKDKNWAFRAILTNTIKEKENRTFLLVISGIFFFLLLAISSNFFMPYLWYDEAGQFWISKGLNHDSDPMAHTNGINAVIENNRSYNLDPGGFSILLHFWTIVSNHYLWLRFLPFLFFLGIVMSFIYLSYLWTKNLNIALLMGFMPVIAPKMIYIAFEVRAYSMECLGTVLGIVALVHLKNNLTNKQLLLWGILFSFFMTSRYSESIVIAVISLYILFLILYSDKRFSEKFLSTGLYLFPLFLAASYSYFAAFRFQSEGSGVKALYYLKYLSNDKSILFEPLNFLALCLIGSIPVLFLLKEKYPIIRKYTSLLFVTFGVNFLFITLSFMGKYPWDMQNSRSISCIVLLTLLLTAFLGELLHLLFEKVTTFKYYLVVFFLLILLFARKDSLLVRAQYRYNTYYTLKNMDMTQFHRIYVDRWESPAIRYLFEYGQLKSIKETNYPEKFTFAKFGPSCSKTFNNEYRHFYSTQPQMNDLLDFDLLIVPEMKEFSTKNDKWQLLAGTRSFYIKAF